MFVVQRAGAALLGVFLLAFALLGFARGQSLFSTRGTPVLRMTSNDLLSAISVIVAGLLLVAAALVLSGTINLFVLQTRFNVLAFALSNAVFSFVVGLLLVVGGDGRFTGNLPPDSPYAHRGPPQFVDETVHTPAEAAAEEKMRTAEIAVVQRTATPEQRRRVQASAQAHNRVDRREAWMRLAESEPGGQPGVTAPAVPAERMPGRRWFSWWGRSRAGDATGSRPR